MVHRLYTAGASPTPPSVPADMPNPGYYPSDNAIFDPYTGHMLIEEMVNVLDAAGLSPDVNSVDQLATAIQTMIAAGSGLPDGYMSGLKPVYNDAGSIKIKAGTCKSDDGTDTIILPSEITISFANTPGDPLAPDDTEDSDAWYYAWMGKGASGVTGVVSKSRTTPTLPAGYNTVKRMLPFAFRNHSGNILPFDVTGWESKSPYIGYRNHEYATAPYRVLTNGTNTSWTAISSANIQVVVPPISKMIDIWSDQSSGGGSAVFLRPGGSGLTTGMFAGNADGGGAMAYHTSHVILGDSQALDYRVASAGNIDVEVRGFHVNNL